MVAQTQVSPDGQKEKIKPKIKKEKVEEVKTVAPVSVDSENQKAPVEKVEEVKTEALKEEKKKVEVKKVIKDVTIANAYSIPVSTKNCVAICKFIRTKTIDRAIEMMNLVLKKKMAVPMVADEIPHRKRSLMPAKFGGGGRFPENAAKEMINLLGQLKANCDVNGVENPVITLAIANLASRPFRKEGRRTKRTNVHLEARDKTKLIIKNKK